MKAINNLNIVEIPDNDTNHCKYCRERLGKRFIISNSTFYCNIECLRGHLSFKREIREDKSRKYYNVFAIVISTMSVVISVIVLTY